MADQIGTSSTNSLLIIIPSRGDVDWDQDIKNLCFEPISSHDHTGNGNGHTIGTGALEDGAVTHPKLGDASVKEDKIFTGAVTSSKIATGAITSDKLATGSVTNLKIGDAQVDQPKLDAALNILINKIDPMRADLTAAETQIIFDGINIASNTTNIATNAASIVSNDSDIAANAVNIATNDNDIATNASNISSNDTDIATNASNIFGNSTNISTNSAAIANLELSDLTNVSSTSPTAGQVLKWGGSEWAPGTDASAAGGGLTVIANQTDANGYSTSEGDTLKITGTVTFTDVTFNKLNIYVDDGITLTFNSSDVAECKITGGNVIFKGTSSHSSDSTVQTTGIDTFSIKRSQIFCEQVDILQELAEQSGLVTTTVEDTFINCKTYRYYTTHTSISSGGSPDSNPTASLSTFNNVTIIAQSEGTISSGQTKAVAVYSDILVSNLSVITTVRTLLFDAANGNDDQEEGTKTNCNKISTTSA